jgi:hypothetical protein
MNADCELSAQGVRMKRLRIRVVKSVLIFFVFIVANSCGGGSTGSSVNIPPPAPSGSTDFIVVAGETDSTNFPVSTGAQQPQFRGVMDGFVTSLSLTSGASASWRRDFSTYLGGDGVDQVRDIFLDAQGNIYMTGRTSSTNLPITPGVFQPQFGGGPMDAYVVKFSPDGQLLLATYLGGGTYDVGYAIFVDGAGFIYVAGRTSGGFPVTPGAAQTVYAGGRANEAPYFGGDMFVAKLRPDLGAMVWATYAGGSNDDAARGRIVVDSSGAVFVEGGTTSTDFPVTPNAFQQTAPAPSSGVLVKVAQDGRSFVYSTYIGGGGSTGGQGAIGGLEITAQGEAFVCGSTSATSFPTTPSAFQRTPGGGLGDVFLVRLSADGSTMLAGTLLGGGGVDTCQGLALDSAGNPVVLATTNSPGFPTTPGAFQSQLRGGSDMAVVKFAPDLSRILFSTLLGGSGDELGDTLRLVTGRSDNLIVILNTSSTDFPVTSGAVQTTLGGKSDAAVVELAADGSRLVFSTFLGGGGTDFPRTVGFRRK